MYLYSRPVIADLITANHYYGTLCLPSFDKKCNGPIRFLLKASIGRL